MSLYKKPELLETIFTDIETTAQKKSFSEVSKELQEVWKKKYAPKSFKREIDDHEKKLLINPEDESPTPNYSDEGIYEKYAPLYAEFGKVLCITVGVFDENFKEDLITLVNNEDYCKPNKAEYFSEKDLLIQLKDFLDSKINLKLGGFNIKGFDIPFLIKRYLLNGIELPKMFQIRGKKPWEVTFLDTMEDWKGMGWEATALETLALCLGLPSPKDKFHNYELNSLLKEGKISLDDVAEYCEKDVRTVMLVALKMSK